MGIKNIEAFYPLSPMQQGMLFHSLAAPNSGVYFEQFGCTFKGDFNLTAFNYAWQQIVDRHPILRTGFAWEGLKEPVQIVHKQVEIACVEKDWRHLSTEEQEKEIKKFLERDRTSDFDLTRPSLMRLTLIRLADDNYHFVWSQHHLLLDGWSVPIIFQEVFAFYQAFIQDEKLTLPTPRPYRDYIVWLQQQDINQVEAFWRNTLQGFTTPTQLLGFGDRQKQNLDDDYDRQSIFLDSSITKALESFSQKHQLTLNTIIQGAWALLLSRYGNEKDVVFGATISGRPTTLAQSESMVGLFINTLPVRVKIDSEVSVLAWLQKIQTQQLEARQYEYSSLIEIQGWSEVPRNLSLFETIVVFENYPTNEIPLSEEDFNLDIDFAHNFDRTNYPITLNVSPGEELSLEIAYEISDRYNSDRISRMLGHLSILLESMAIDPQQHLSELPLLTKEEKQQVLFDWNDNKAEYPVDKCLHTLFEEQVSKTPDAIAAVFENRQLTYRELNNRANQLARLLQNSGLIPGEFVGIYQERSLNFAIAILAVLKTGAVYIPMDCTYPAARIEYMLSNSQAKFLLTDRKCSKNILNSPEDYTELEYLICLDSSSETDLNDLRILGKQSWLNLPTDNLELDIKPTGIDPAYTIYTSGSTGKPKGTIIRHGGAINHIYAEYDALNLTSNLTFLQSAPASSDISVWQFLAPVLIGGKTVIIDSETVCNPDKLLRVIRESQITLIELVPVVLRSFINYLSEIPEAERQLTSLQWMMVTGESVAVDLVNSWLNLYPNIPIVNAYGPSEASDDITQAIIDEPLPTNQTTVSIGKPLANLNLYILDSNLNLVPVGVPGEICVSGYGVGVGYWRNEEKTQASFIANPFGETAKPLPGVETDLLYKTGDLGKWLENGSIEYLGRIDNQVKIRGFRIELGEIEAQLQQHPLISDCVVIAAEDSQKEKRLVAYYIAARELEVKQLREYLKPKLPDYMIPAAWVQLEALPLTPNGKVDRKSLPTSDFTLTTNNYLAPRNSQEEILTNIWQEVLDVEQVSINDNFFELGGHSLLATRLISRVKQVFKTELPLRSLFEYPTIANLAECIQTSLNPSWQSEIKIASRKEKLPLSFAQQRLWFLAQLEPNSPDYNLPAAFSLKGKLDVTAFQESFDRIVERHEVLRTRFIEINGEARQVVESSLKLDLEVIETQELLTKKQVRETIDESALKPFDLSKTPLFRIKLLRLNPEEHILIVVMHHIISDFWSEDVLLQEFASLYESKTNKQAVKLPELPIQYADFAVWQREYLQNEILGSHLDYWQQQFTGELPVLEFYSQLNKVTPVSDRGAIYDFNLDRDLSDKIQAFSQQENTTLFITLLTAFKVLLSIETKQQDIIIGTPIANRDRLELESLIGFFVNTLLLRTNLSGEPTFRELLGRVREVTLNGYAHQALPFEKLVEILQPNRQEKSLPFLQVWFTLTNNEEKEFTLPNLTIDEIDFDTEIERYQLRLDFAESLTGIQASFGYKTDLFEADYITVMAKSLETIFQQVTTNPNITLTELTTIIMQIKQEYTLTKEKELARSSSRKLKNIKRKIIKEYSQSN